MTDAAAPAPTGRQTVLVALGQGSVMATGGILAILIAQLFGKNTDTDAFFAAYGFYTVGITLGGTFRFTAIPRLVADTDGRTSTRMLGAVALMAAALLVPMVLLASPLGTVLIAQDPGAVAPATLRILWFALAAQILAALLAALLSVRGRFTALGLAMLFAGFVSLPLFVALEGSVGVKAAAIAVTGGGLWQVAVSLTALRRDGWRPHALLGGTTQALGQVARQAGYLIGASGPFLGTAVAYVICVAIVSRQGAGEATLFAYAFVVASVLLGMTAYVSAQVHSPSVMASTDRRGEAIEASGWTLRFSLLLCGPVLTLVCLVGAPVLGFVLGGDFSDRDVTTVLTGGACMAGWLFASAASVFAVIELLAQERLRALGVIAVVQVLVSAALALVAAPVAGVPGVALALSLTQIGVAAAQMHLAFGPALPALGRDVLDALGRELVVVVAMAVPALVLLLAVGGVGGTVAAGVVAAVAAIVATLRMWPQESRSLLGLLRRA